MVFKRLLAHPGHLEGQPVEDFLPLLVEGVLLSAIDIYAYYKMVEKEKRLTVLSCTFIIRIKGL